jgi:ADP-heptose:LPS heptosyltransferase
VPAATRSDSSALVLFPGSLGDFICVRPALRGLEAVYGRTALIARPGFFELLDAGRWRCISIDRRAVADLYGSGPLAAETRALLGTHDCVFTWSGSGEARFAERLREATGAEVRAFAFRGMGPGEHAAAYYARCAGVELRICGLAPGAGAEAWADGLWRRYGLRDRVLCVHPGSGGGHKNWEGMKDIAAWWRGERGKVVALIGPVEDERGGAVPCDAVVREASLLRVAAVVRRAAVYLGNDSGVSHLAGIAGARGLVLFGPTEPNVWRPLGGGIEVLAAERECRGCGGRFCVHRLPVERVRAALAALAPE